MYRKLLLAYDASTEGRRALREGAKLARLCRSEVFLLAVVELSTGIVIAEGAAAGVVENQGEDYQEVLREGVRRLESLGFKPTARLEYGNPAHEIAAVAQEIGADLVVVGHRNQSSLARWWNGSVGASLLEELRCSLLIAQIDVDEQREEEESEVPSASS